jgi:hypothetical protein
MASGHGYRTQRPNTWLLRPSLRRDDSSCQPGAVHTWPVADMAAAGSDVRFRGQSGPGRGGAECRHLMLWTAPTLRHRGAIGWLR